MASRCQRARTPPGSWRSISRPSTVARDARLPVLGGARDLEIARALARDAGAQAGHLADGVVLNALVEALGRAQAHAHAERVVLGRDRVVADRFANHPPQHVALQLHGRSVVPGLDELAVLAIRVGLGAAVAVLDADDAARGVVGVLGLAARGAEDLGHAAGLVALILPANAVEAALDLDAAGGVELELVDVTVLVLDGGEALLGVVDEADARPGLGARRDAPHALIREAHVVLLIARVNDVAFRVVVELAQVAVGLDDAHHAPERIVLALLHVAGGVERGRAATETIVTPAGHRAVGRAQRRDVALGVVVQAGVLARRVGQAREPLDARRFAPCRRRIRIRAPVKLHAPPERIHAPDEPPAVVVAPRPLTAHRVDRAHRLVVRVEVDRDRRAVGADHADDVAARVVRPRRLTARRVGLLHLPQRTFVVLVRGRAAERVDHLHDAADGVHLVRRRAPEAVGHARDLADLVVVDDVVVDAAVAPRPHAVRVLAPAVVREVERQPVAVGLLHQQMALVRESPRMPERIGRLHQIAGRVVGVARVHLPRVLFRRVRQLGRDQPPGAVVLERDRAARRVVHPREVAARVVLERERAPVARDLPHQPRPRRARTAGARHRRELERHALVIGDGVAPRARATSASAATARRRPRAPSAARGQGMRRRRAPARVPRHPDKRSSRARPRPPGRASVTTRARAARRGPPTPTNSCART